MKAMITGLALAGITLSVEAAPITFTGAELAALPNATAVGGIHTISGDSLLITATSDRQILFNLNLSDFVLDGSDIGFVANVTRLTTSGGFRDNDIRLGLTDTRNYVYAEFNNLSTAPNVVPRHNRSFITNGGLNFSGASPFGVGTGFGYEFGQAANLGVIIRPAAGFTQIFSTFNGQGGFTSVTDTNRLDPVFFDLSFTIGGFLNTQRYLINSLTFNSGVALPEPQSVPEPAPLAGLGLGLLGLGGFIQRRRKTS